MKQNKTRFKKKLGLTTLETRRLKGDLIEVFKTFKVYDDIGEDISKSKGQNPT